MPVIEFSTFLFAFAYLAGIVGAMTGLGGGVILIPVMVLLFKIDIHYAMGASLISVIATSSGAAIAYLRQGYTNLRVGMLLETSAVIGALIGASLVAIFPTSLLAVLFGLVLIFSSFLAWKRKEDAEALKASDPLAVTLRLEGSYPTLEGEKNYAVHNVILGWGIMGFAGIISGLLGIGSGALKVLAMDQALHLPYKVSTTTSNFMIGITATVGAGVYFARGYIDPYLTFPIVVGVLFGAFTGAKILMVLHSRILRAIFSIIVFLLALEMIYKGLIGYLSP